MRFEATRIKWRRFLLFFRNLRALRKWAWGIAKDFAEYDIEIFDGDQLSEALDKLESKIHTEQAAQAMSDLFHEPGPFQRRVVKGPF